MRPSLLAFTAQTSPRLLRRHFSVPLSSNAVTAQDEPRKNCLASRAIARLRARSPYWKGSVRPSSVGVPSCQPSIVKPSRFGAYVRSSLAGRLDNVSDRVRHSQNRRLWRPKKASMCPVELESWQSETRRSKSAHHHCLSNQGGQECRDKDPAVRQRVHSSGTHSRSAIFQPPLRAATPFIPCEES